MEILNHIVLTNSHIRFEEQLPSVLRRYSNLKIIKDESGTSYLKGVLDVPNDNNEIVGHFFIEIHASERFPYQFPILFEIGGEIPLEPDWHRNKNGSCCITFWTDEIVKCKNGISVSSFVEQYAIPYLANHIHKRQTGEYKNGEYAHGLKAIGQYYQELMKTGDRMLWLQYYRNAFRNLSIHQERNDLCFCGSGIKYKKCHLKVFNTLKEIGEEQVLRDFRLLEV